MAVPLGVLGAIYLNEYGGKGPLAQIVRFMSNVMTGVPSIVMGLFIFTIWVLHFGLSGFAGALALGCLMLPIVIRSSEEMRLLVPNSLREGSFALGATQVPGDLDGSVASGDRWHCQRRIAGRGPSGRNGAFALHHPHGDSDKLEPVQGPQHSSSFSNLRKRDATVHGRSGAGLGRRADSRRDRLYRHANCPFFHRPLYQKLAIGTS